MKMDSITISPILWDLSAVLVCSLNPFSIIRMMVADIVAATSSNAMNVIMAPIPIEADSDLRMILDDGSLSLKQSVVDVLLISQITSCP